MAVQRAEGVRPFPWKAAVGMVVFTLLPAIMFLIAWTVNWPGAWALLALGLAGTVISRVLVALKYPDLIQERGRYREHEDTKAWDKKLVPVVAIYGPFLVWVVAGLDRRWGWSAAPAPWLQWVALVGIALGYALGIWAMLVNRFFAAVVRIQTDRGHTVVTGGPYRWMRHPAYASTLVVYLLIPVLLGTWWAYVPAALIIVALVVRTALEDRTLRAELPGYEAYTQQTRYRLVPGVW